MHFRPHPKGYMKGVTPVLPLTLKNSTLMKKILDGNNEVCVIYFSQLLGNIKKSIYHGEEAIEKAKNLLMPYKDDMGHIRTVTRFRKDEKYCIEANKEVFDWDDYFFTTDDISSVYIGIRSKIDSSL